MTRIVCRQLAPRIADLAANHRLALDTMAEATPAADILVLPELVTSGYVFESVAETAANAIPADDPRFAEWAAAISGYSIVIAGFAERGADGVYNSAVVLDPTGVLAVYRKAHLWDREKLFFQPGAERPPVIETRFGRIGVLICYDLEFPEFTRQVAVTGADLLAVPTNWPRTDRPDGEHWPEVIIAQAAAKVNRMAIAACDRTGTERGQDWNEGTSIIDHNGWIIATAGNAGTASADLDLALARDKMITPHNHLFTDRRTELYG